MTSGPVMIQCLEGENAIAKNRELMGATDPKKADKAPSAPTSPSRSTPTPCMARRRKTAAVEMAFFFRHERFSR